MRGSKTNTKSCFYALIFQVLSVRDHKASLTTLDLRHDALGHSVDGLGLQLGGILLQLSLHSDIDHWQLGTDQLNRIHKSLVDKARDATLAACFS